MSVLTHAQRAFLSNFFARTRAFYLTGGGALAEYYLGHRLSQDIDLFTQDREAWQSIESDLQAAAAAVGASLEFRAAQESNELHRAILRLPDEPDLKIDIVRDAPPHFGEPTMREDGVIVDTLENIAVGKLSALYGRAYPRDFVDLYFLLNSGVDFKKLVELAKKDSGVIEFYLAGMIRQVTKLQAKHLPTLLKPLDLEDARGFLAADDLTSGS